MIPVCLCGAPCVLGQFVDQWNQRVARGEEPTRKSLVTSLWDV